MTRTNGGEAGGFNLEKAITEHAPAELAAAEKEVRDLDRKLDAARERVYRLKNILSAAGHRAPEPEPKVEEAP